MSRSSRLSIVLLTVIGLLLLISCSSGGSGGMTGEGEVALIAATVDGQPYMSSNSANYFHMWAPGSIALLTQLQSGPLITIRMTFDEPSALPYVEPINVSGFDVYAEIRSWLPDDGFTHVYRGCQGQVTLTEYIPGERLKGTFTFTGDENYSTGDPACAAGLLLEVTGGEFDVPWSSSGGWP